MKAKHQRLTRALLAVAAVVAAGLLALSALQDKAAFFYAPADVKRDGLPLGKAVRLGGMVQAGSVRRAADGVTVAFTVGDGQATTPVRFAGIVPDLFREGSGVVAEGQFNPDGSFTASNLLAKHDEKYMPPPLVKTAAGEMHQTKSLAP